MVGTKPFWKDGTMMTNHRESLSKVGWTEEQIIQYDELALEDHSDIATRGERDRIEKSWALKFNKEGAQGPTNQRPDLVEANREMKRLHDEHVKETSEGNTPIHPVQRSRQPRHQQFEGLEYIYQVDAQTRGPILRSRRETCRGIQHIRPRQLSGNSTTIGNRTEVGILGDPHPGLNSSDFFFVQRCLSRLPEIEFPGNRRGGCRQMHLPHATFSHVQSLHKSHSTDDMCAWLKFEPRPQNRSLIHASCFTLLLTVH